MESLSANGVAWGVAGQPHPSQTILGDGYVVRPLRRGCLLAVMDGLGHGAEAAAAAALCMETLATSAEMPVPAVLGLCHRRLKGTRGVTASVVLFDYGRGEMSWGGVGNVVGALLRSDPAARPGAEILVQRSGVLGIGSPALVAASVALRKGDLVVLATDGIGTGFERTVDRGRSPQDTAERILAGHAKRTDDALVLVGRYLGVVA